MTERETLGQRLQRLRKDHGLTQEQLAENTGLSVHNVRNWEHDHRLPGLVAVFKLARALEVPMEEFAACVVDRRTGKRGRRPEKGQ